MKHPHLPSPDGVLLVDKPAGCTSFEVVKKVKRWAAPSKVGHTGTLDPMATGLLPLCLGEATKLVRFLSGEPKRYLAKVRLGIGTDTGDREGQEVERKEIPRMDTEHLQQCLRSFEGQIRQIPPMYSALKHRGKRMYQLARSGIEVERPSRLVTVRRLSLTDSGPDWLELDVTCSAGTYIRSLAEDIARRMGTVGHLTALTRTESDGWTLDMAHDLNDLSRESLARALIPFNSVLSRFPMVDVPAAVADRLAQGQHLGAGELADLGVKTPEKQAIAWFRSLGGSPIIVVGLRPHPRGTVMKILRVLCPRQEKC